MFKDIFNKKPKYATVNKQIHPTVNKTEVPEGIVIKCPSCKIILYTRDLEKTNKVCSSCNHHFPLSAPERIELMIDEGTFQEIDQDLISTDPLNFPTYSDKVESDRKKTNLNEAIVTGVGELGGVPVVIGVMDSRFRMGSMGSVVGEKITRAIEEAIKQKRPFILYCASGGARMQEGVLSLMQMAKTSAALHKLSEAGLLFIPILTNPTTGGVSASFAMLGDIIMAEPKALIGFAGRRIIEQTIRQQLPEDFQTAEFLLKHGQIDLILDREDAKKTLTTILELHQEEST